MKYNTMIDYPMTAMYQPWEEEEREGGTWRKYAPPEQAESIRCYVSVTVTGGIVLTSPQELQQFAAVQGMTDATGNPFMNTSWYSVQRVVPVFDALGNLSSYRHSLAAFPSQLITEPLVDRRVPDFGFDQQV